MPAIHGHSSSKIHGFRVSVGKLKYPWSTRNPRIPTRGCGYFASHIRDGYGWAFERDKSMGLGAGQPMDYPCSALIRRMRGHMLGWNMTIWKNEDVTSYNQNNELS